MAFLRRFVTAYLNPLEVDAIFEGLAVTFPHLCRLEHLPYLSHGYFGARVEARGRHPMKVLRITSPQGTSPKPAVMVMRSPHAREWINGLAVVETARQCLENYRPADMDPEVRAMVALLDAVELLVVPEGNPDGARLSFFDPGQRLWRKNLRPPVSAGECPGVDCNRNYPRYFGQAGSSGSSCSETYRGPSALSEPDALNIAWLLDHNRNVVFAIDSHSSGEALFRPNPNGGSFVSSLPVPPADHQVYLALEAEMNAAISTVRGTTYDTGTTSNHAGSFDEFSFFDHHVYGFDLECGRDFQPDIDEAIIAALEVAEAVKALGACATGSTGLDVASMLLRRQNYPPMVLPAPADLNDGLNAVDTAKWTMRPPKPEEQRRYLAECEATTSDPHAERLRLMEEGFDVEDSPPGSKWEMILSPRELELIKSRGYHPQIVRDYYDSSRASRSAQ